MSYYPILNAPYCSGETTLYNFPPNNWEPADKVNQYVNLTFTQDGIWRSLTLGNLDYQAYKKIDNNDVTNLIPEGALPLLSLSKSMLPRTSKELPVLNCNHTVVPAYRSTLSLKSDSATTSYQGEVNPFPPQASLLTFSPFLQFGVDIENYLLLLNLEKLPQNRMVEVEIYDAHSKLMKKKQDAYSNRVNIISLGDAEFDEQSLPVVICREMAAIPLYFSSYKKGKLLSLEHTHPPASFVVHGNRFDVQKQLKQYWFSQLRNDK
ncbi:hypothetical protein OAK82_02245 [Candidatus Thioglobus sp.]|nr:hypothetical protein [Candidatus Thioglobus sp.]